MTAFGALLTLVLLAPLPAGALTPPPGQLAGLSLTEALGRLGERGLKLVFNSNVVRPEMVVEEEPQATAPLEVLDELLVPHGLVAQEAPAGTLVILSLAREVQQIEVRGAVLDEASGAPVAGARISSRSAGRSAWSGPDGSFRIVVQSPGVVDLEAEHPAFATGILRDLPVGRGLASVEFRLEPLLREFDEIIVTPSRFSLRREQPSPSLSLEGEEARALRRFSEDLLRGLTLAPGVSAAESSAQLSIRGGRGDENLVLVDGMELVEPYHLHDFGSALSIVASELVERAELIAGGSAAEFGGRAGGVIKLETASHHPARAVLATGLLESHALKSGQFADGQASWLGLARVGTFDQALQIDGRRERPDFRDAFGKVRLAIGGRQSLTGNFLFADDHLDFRADEPAALKDYQTRYRSGYLWFSHLGTVSPRVVVESVTSYGRLSSQRDAHEMSAERQVELADQRTFFQLGLKQNWELRASEDHTLKWGGELRHFDSHHRYARSVDQLDRLQFAGADAPSREGEFDGTFREELWSFYLSDLIRLRETLRLEAGLRLDRYTLTGRTDLSPRLNLSYSPSPKTVFRVALGGYIQNQRPYELAVIDGETDFALAERSEQRILSFERSLRPGLTFRAEAYRRVVKNPRPRFENLFEPTSAFPEVQADRFRIAPERSESSGVEVVLRGQGSFSGWWIHYARSRVNDRLDGREVFRRTDEPHALKVSVDRRLGDRWRVAVAGQYHTGWPTTPVLLGRSESPSGEVRPTLQLGPLFSSRMPAYHRVDLRIGRSWEISRGRLEAFLNLQNLYDRENVRGYEFEVTGGEAHPQVRAVPEYWNGLFPSFGVRWEL